VTPVPLRLVAGAAVLGTGVLAYGLAESQWLRVTRPELPVLGLPDALDGLVIVHLSDFHAGSPGLNLRVMRMAVDAALALAPDLVVITGDLRARLSGDAELRRQLARLAAVPGGAFAVLGNHDIGSAHDPFADRRVVVDLDGTGVRLLSDTNVVRTLRGRTVAVAGIAPRSYTRRRADGRALACAADFRILACHYPHVFDRIRPGDYDLVLAGHLHGGQIALPLPGGKFRFSHLSRRYLEGFYGREGTTLHISRGVGTTFLPLRVAARPEVTAIVLRSAVNT
jgi:predicted MPP superfamily phosphohydrolase